MKLVAYIHRFLSVLAQESGYLRISGQKESRSMVLLAQFTMLCRKTTVKQRLANQEDNATKCLHQLLQAWFKACLSIEAESFRKTILREPVSRWEWMREYAESTTGSTTVLFITESGFFGVAPDNIAPGDRVALLDGRCKPMTLRPRSHGQWTFRGFCEVWGVSALQHQGDILKRLPEISFVIH